MNDPDWRVRNLYMVVDRHGIDVPFRLNPMQEDFIERIWFHSLILKSRQLGFTTCIAVWAIDKAIFVPNTTVVVIAHKKDDAESILERKYEYVYANLHPGIKQLVQVTERNKTHMKFGNGSQVVVTTSGRSGTAQIIHISEFGYTSRYNPEKAREIKEGTFPSIHPTWNNPAYMLVESTAEGNVGEFHSLAQNAMRMQRERRKLTPNDFRFFFYPWHTDTNNTVAKEDVEKIPISDRLDEYFESLKIRHNIVLTKEQRAWYASEESKLEDGMRKEQPSFPDEAFQGSGEGGFLTRQMQAVRDENRIVDDLPLVDMWSVDTAWDIGTRDGNGIWFVQPVGEWFHIMAYYENIKEGMDYSIAEVRKINENRGFYPGTNWGPHDIEQSAKFNNMTPKQEAEKMGFKFTTVPRVQMKMTAIDCLRRFLGRCKFHREGTAEGVALLDKYMKRYDPVNQAFSDVPVKNGGDRAADALMQFAMAYELQQQAASRPKAVPDASLRGGFQGSQERLKDPLGQRQTIGQHLRNQSGKGWYV